jgi:hypothetical protein
MQIVKYTAVVGVNGRGKLILNGQTLIRIYSPYTEGESATMSFTFAYPYILKSGESIQVTSESANGLAIAGFSGFLIRNQDLQY